VREIASLRGQTDHNDGRSINFREAQKDEPVVINWGIIGRTMPEQAANLFRHLCALIVQAREIVLRLSGQRARMLHCLVSLINSHFSRLLLWRGGEKRWDD
jgi:hypothetical protein